MSKPIIEIQNLSKLYHIGARERMNKTFREAIAEAFSAPVRNFLTLRRLTRFEADKDDTIWALKDVSFDVYPGEVVGVIGRNGAGKSTLLKILSRITEPTSGRVNLYGRISSLLEVGTGFHPELTGRENIYLNGTILGMRKADIDKRFDEIVAFSEIEKFIDTPIKRYSSGMYVRLAFAVAANLQPDILLVDEVLAVGDIEFQKKCLGRMGQVATEGRTILFVSHNLSAVLNLCSRAIVLKDGALEFSGKVPDAIDHYLSEIRRESVFNQDLPKNNTANSLSIRNFEMRPNQPQTGSPVEFTFEISNDTGRQDALEVDLAIAVKTEYGSPLFQLYSKHSGASLSIRKNLTKITCRIESLPLSPGRYVINLWLGRGKQAIDFIPDAMFMNVASGSLDKKSYVESTGYPVIMLSQWQQNPS